MNDHPTPIPSLNDRLAEDKEQLNHALAEALGCKPVWYDYYRCGCPDGAHSDADGFLIDYLSAAGMLALLEEMRGRGWYCEVSSIAEDEGPWWALFQWREEERLTHRGASAAGKTPCEAVASAALAALEQER